MAENTIRIKFEPKDADKLKRAIESLDKSTKALISSQTKLSKEGKKVRDTQEKLNDSMDKGSQRTRILGGTIAVLRSKLLLFNFAVGFAIRSLGRFTAQSSKVESMERAFTTLSGGMNNSEIAITKLKDATNNTMSEFDLFQQANNAMVLGVTKNSDEMAEMFDVAQRLGRALGRDTASSVESLVTGIGRQSRLMLDNIGIIVDTEKAYEDYAESLDKTADALTDIERKQAFFTATMDSARTKVKTIGDETKTSQDIFDTFKASMSNLATAIGENLTVFESLAIATSNIADSITESIKPLGKMEELERRLVFQHEMLIAFHSVLAEKMKGRNEASIQATQVDITLTEQRMTAIQNEIDALKAQDEEKAEIARKEKERIEGLQEAERKRAGEKLEAEKSLKEQQRQADLALGFANRLSSALAQATLNGQNMGEAVVNSIKAIAVEMASKAFIFTAFQALGIGGVGTAGKTLGQFLGIAHTGGLIKDNGKVQKFATGGMVQGQDNVPIMAQAGEFVIRKAVVEQVGVDNIARLNNGEGGLGTTINVNISGGVVDESYINNELIPALNKATSLGNTINA